MVDSEEYDEDEEEARHRKKRKKDSRYGGFIIDEAEVRFIHIFLLALFLFGLFSKHDDNESY